MDQLTRKLTGEKKFIIFGGGFSGIFFANEVRKLGCKAFTSYRSRKIEKDSFFFDSNSQKLPDLKLFKGVTHILSCIPPDKYGLDPVLSKLKNILQHLSLEWVGYLSTTGVYGNVFGEWVSEQTTPKPLQERSKRRLICETEWLHSQLPSQIFRLPGIYGPGRSTLESIIYKNIKVIHKPKQVFSRIHVEDIAHALIYLLNNNFSSHKIINIADDQPTSQLEVIKYSYHLLGKTMPEIIQFEEAERILSPIALSFWQENRRISNKLLCNELGYKLIHKNYKTGLDDCFKYIKIDNL